MNLIYYQDDKIIVRKMEEKDADSITKSEINQGFNVSVDKYVKRINDQKKGIAHALVATYNEEPVGYINVYPNSNHGAFAGKGYSEIVDFGVLEKFRNQGIGTILMNVAEDIALKYSNIVYLGVGLHIGYGNAQRMYIRRGYIPDGSGVWYRDAVCKPYTVCKNDDDLVLYLYKNLRDF